MKNRRLISFSSNSQARFVFYPITFSEFPRTILLKDRRYDSLRFRYEFRSLRGLCDCSLAMICFLILLPQQRKFDDSSLSLKSDLHLKVGVFRLNTMLPYQGLN